MDLWRGLTGVGLVALVVAGLAVAGSYSAIEATRAWATELVSVSYVAFFLGVAALLAATVARGISQVGRAVGLARRAD
jgi:hypothetical protein